MVDLKDEDIALLRRMEKLDLEDHALFTVPEVIAGMAVALNELNEERYAAGKARIQIGLLGRRAREAAEAFHELNQENPTTGEPTT